MPAKARGYDESPGRHAGKIERPATVFDGFNMFSKLAGSLSFHICKCVRREKVHALSGKKDIDLMPVF